MGCQRIKFSTLGRYNLTKQFEGRSRSALLRIPDLPNTTSVLNFIRGNAKIYRVLQNYVPKRQDIVPCIKIREKLSINVTPKLFNDSVRDLNQPKNKTDILTSHAYTVGFATETPLHPMVNYIEQAMEAKDSHRSFCGHIRSLQWHN